MGWVTQDITAMKWGGDQKSYAMDEREVIELVVKKLDRIIALLEARNAPQEEEDD